MAIPKVGETFILGHKNWTFKYHMTVVSFDSSGVLCEYKELSDKAFTGRVTYSVYEYSHMCDQLYSYTMAICHTDIEDDPEYSELFI